jgi:hypothetical protein
MPARFLLSMQQQLLPLRGPVRALEEQVLESGWPREVQDRRPERAWYRREYQAIGVLREPTLQAEFNTIIRRIRI